MDSVFQELYDKYHQDLFQFLIYLVKDRQLAEDLSQEVYIKVLKAYGRFEGKSSEKTWLFSIARNAAIDHFRKQRTWKQRLFSNFDWDNHQISDPGVLPEEIAVQNENLRQIYKALDYCSMDQRSVIVLRYIQSLTISETALVLDWTESKVKITQHRALKAIKKIMDDHAGKEEYSFEKIPVE
ncbi:RNA polymerase sigma factor SigX [Peribacillus sp. SCS-155]|uniref:RNA polymerase sigma factor SigX n=1 Tax=Peribacillus sedimenti TaxID=3115297 RepID=UPI0039066133